MSTKNERREPHMTSSDTTSPILITGATGRHGGTGAHLARRLREAGQSVRALVRRLDERTAPLQALGAEIVLADRRRSAQPRRDRARAERGALAANPLRAHHARGLAGRVAGAR